MRRMIMVLGTIIALVGLAACTPTPQVPEGGYEHVTATWENFPVTSDEAKLLVVWTVDDGRVSRVITADGQPGEESSYPVRDQAALDQAIAAAFAVRSEDLPCQDAASLVVQARTAETDVQASALQVCQPNEQIATDLIDQLEEQGCPTDTSTGAPAIC